MSTEYSARIRIFCGPSNVWQIFSGHLKLLPTFLPKLGQQTYIIMRILLEEVIEPDVRGLGMRTNIIVGALIST